MIEYGIARKIKPKVYGQDDNKEIFLKDSVVA
jgi:hypothetical protein